MALQRAASEAKRVKAKYGEHNPIRLCAAMGIHLMYAAMGNGEKSCKGFFLYQSRCKTIVVNDQMDENYQRVILTHELGHAVLHSPAAGVAAYHDFGLFVEASTLEHEANVFAAEYLLDDKLVLDELADAEVSFFDAASALAVPPELLTFKLRLLKKAGYPVDLPMNARADFLKKASCGAR
ncbi:MAG: ImmA/IrrE family metallo-endopeptidase [Oscillospiraceae bacterium]|jgi:Zn-dependent peptidase ImmA (M78 family)|nr:ImmA/IrrE family metallo-endopeptidase [Oscillospiraceae bacterium]